MRNIKLTLQYDGTNFSGFELQPKQRTVRGELEKALFNLFKKKIKVIGVSRTDAKVHALDQVVNFHFDGTIKLKQIPAALNSCLPYEIRILTAEEVASDYNSRYMAKSKKYEYLIFNGDQRPPALLNIVWHVKPKLNLSAMQKAAKILQGKHNFKSFCAAHSDDKDFVKELFRISIRQRKVKIWDGCEFRVMSFEFVGNGFLYKMVRNIVGTLVEVGLGKLSLTEVKKILKAQDRNQAGRTAPGQGLCLVKVNY
ncbi:tRNA pseudouridine(38-40) synthase TruA [candidate division WOR-1 bacterium RIFOXYB2_FULL_42_35]|uniref:tRNA pseudouridine synthase A n=1 Tax=candidate division WOR-1 bacterium RIFOXYC2_FULL_41_25 TaxID=1802586 RepID=A0A1F4TPJ7_UNCSA|nr:MAG: tRNA pseudouridine(38-40) synthase TruA [candidate division WOR-1 bacterium RIFOXYB2_FULL_42_35]OGC24598.1 MAG: tRNA pseudouridine(38-40) synthase TruA [candidate division WOR-1 bacterium RIFOXYA2_FULL_41_14]OGC34644.1 MAG: tRNA pseudouridine(38-40) synthase TruA [candidate division WOR-1 bacterium RIFOXYC2_FULL_41_25]OGC41593.1 MAG: tRNA pseudouridine(38-40) synthase TruA [candidate division WOR-1 bacterium RIFOXYD2_FULL_41_8]